MQASRGRAVQQNAGAESATGSTLLFLHADTRLPENFMQELFSVLDRPDVAAGAFRLGIEGAGASLRLIETVANWRSRFLQSPYGDQGLFLRRDIFESVGGFRPLPVMEDFDLIRRVRKLGRIGIAPSAVQTSARRWNRLGPWRTTLINQAMIAGYYLDLDPARLARLYGRTPGASDASQESPLLRGRCCGWAWRCSARGSRWSRFWRWDRHRC